MADRDARALLAVMEGPRTDPNCVISPGSLALARALGCRRVRHVALSSLLSQPGTDASCLHLRTVEEPNMSPDGAGVS